MRLRRRPPLAHGLSVATLTGLLLLGCSPTDTPDSPPTSEQDDAPEDRATDDEASGSTDAAADDGTGLRITGPEDGASFNANDLADLEVSVTASGPAELADISIHLDGTDVTAAAERDDTTLTWAPGTLDDGERTVAVTTAADGPALRSFTFEVDAEPPALDLQAPESPIVGDTPITVAGSTEPGATVRVGSDQVTAASDGAFELDVSDLEAAGIHVADGRGALTIEVTDTAGNVTEMTEEFAVVASRVTIDEIRTVHATFWAWATPSLRDPIVQMIDDGRINALQLDLKDEGGQLGYASQIPLAQEIGADVGPLDLEATVADLHDRGVAVIGRIVAFADPTLASWAWENGHQDWVIQDNDGSDYYRGSYAGFSNYTHEDVIAYNLDIAEEAARAGVDHILWDYIRRPEGTSNYTVPGLSTTPEAAIAAFTQQADERLAPYGIQHGASVYGIAADRPEQIGQDIPAMAEHLDYVAPMLYPSHWGPGEYGVGDPNRQPYDIITATLEVWDEATAGSRARVVPWFEDTPYRSWDRPFQIREQIRAAADHGIDEWLMWNPGSTFTPTAYPPRD